MFPRGWWFALGESIEKNEWLKAWTGSGLFVFHVDHSSRNSRSQIKQEDPLDLSISISGGKETNQDSLSNGE